VTFLVEDLIGNLTRGKMNVSGNSLLFRSRSIETPVYEKYRG
jgi:hypothetical protein